MAEDPENASWRRNLMISLGNLGDVLASRPTTSAIAPVDWPHSIGRSRSREWAIDKDPADRRAPFDAASALLRRGGVPFRGSRQLVEAGIDGPASRRTARRVAHRERREERAIWLPRVRDRFRLGGVLARANHVAEALGGVRTRAGQGLQFMKGGVYQSGRRAATVEAAVDITIELAQGNRARPVICENGVD